MAFFKLQLIVITLSGLTLLAKAQFISSLSSCVQDCIQNSQDENCATDDIKCFCRASAGSFLPDLVLCIHNNCDNDFLNNVLLTPFQLACEIAGTSIPAAAIVSAENEASSLASQGTVPGTSRPSTAPASSILSSSTLSSETVTTTESGSTSSGPYTITTGSTTTISGSPSISPTTSPSIASPRSTSTNIVQSTSTVVSSKSSSSSASHPSSSGTSKTSTASSATDSPNSAPFKNTNNASSKARGGDWLGLGLGVLLVAATMWF